MAVNTAYYAMLNAARAALSERGSYAKTHSATWTQFSAVFVAEGDFDREPSALARQAKDAREKGDYEASPPSVAEAKQLVAGTAGFLAAVEEMLAG